MSASGCSKTTVHARHVFHLSAAMWAAYEPATKGVFLGEKMDLSTLRGNTASARHESISFAAYRLLLWRFKRSPNYIQTESAANRKMQELGYDVAVVEQNLRSATGPGNLIAQRVIDYGLSDGSNEQNDYENIHYKPANQPLSPSMSGNPDLLDANRWQPLGIPDFVG